MIKLQHLAVIFAIIIIPVSLVLAYYVRSEIDTIKLQATYDEVLINATSDAVKAYQINTEKNPAAVLERSQRRDIEAAVSTFINSFATGLGVGGYGESNIKRYMPAMIFTLYDGFYIYAPTENYGDGTSGAVLEHVLKPYMTYTQRYIKNSDFEKIDVCITYSLDNYISVTGRIDDEYVNESGYLINRNKCTYNAADDTYTLYDNQLGKELLQETILVYDEELGDNSPKLTYKYKYYEGVKYYYDDMANSEGKHWFIYQNGKKYYTNMTIAQNGSEITDSSTYNYIKEAYDFTNWVQAKLGNLTIGNLVLNNDVRERNKDNIQYYNQTDNSCKFLNCAYNADFENEDSIFNIHKNDMIRLTIRENLSSAIAAYNAHSGSNSFQLPLLKPDEWNQLTRNVNVVAFVQGLPVGFKTYNNYAIISNTRNDTFVTKDEMAFIDMDQDQSNPVVSTYHMIDCPYLTEGNLQGYKKMDFEQASVEIKTSEGRETKYYFKHINYPCYYCIVARNYTKQTLNATRQQALRQALYRERQLLHY